MISRDSIRGFVRLGAVVLLALTSAAASAQPAPRSPVGSAHPHGGSPDRIRHFPGGQAVPGLAPRMKVDAAASALRAHADRDLRRGLRVREDVEPVVTRVGRSQVFRFGLSFEGVALASGSHHVAIVDGRGRLLASRTRNLPSSVDASRPTVAPARASEVAVAHARTALGQSGMLSASPPVLEVWVDEARQGRLSWRIQVEERVAQSVRAATRYRVSAVAAPMILEFADAIRYEATVHVEGNLWQLSPNQPTVVAPLSDVPVNAGPIVHSDVDGNAVFPAIIPGASISAQLQGPFAVATTAVPPRIFASRVATGGNDTLSFTATTETALAQVTAFRWTTLANRWARQRLPFLETAGTLLDGLPVSVNEQIPCNALSTGFSLHFGRASGPCNNTATPSIVVHEFGHSLDAALGGLVADFGYAEGFADAVAAFVTGQPCVGMGFIVGSETCMRDATDVTTWPVASSDPHDVGEVYGQFAWALRGGLGTTIAEQLILGSAVAVPSDIPDAVHLAFVVADDDGLLGTCSPNQHVLEAIADSRSLPRPPTCRPAGVNVAPTAGNDSVVFVEDTGGPVDLLGNDFDPDGDPLIVSDVVQGQLGTLDCSTTPCTYTPNPDANGVETLGYTVIDTYGGSATATVRIEIQAVEDLLTIFGPGDRQAEESVALPVAVTVSDPDGPPFTVQWFVGAVGAPAPCSFAAPTSAATTLTCTHEGSFPFGVVVTQGAQPATSAPATLEVLNRHPSVGITSPAAGATFGEGQAVDVSAPFEDGPTAGPHVCTIRWGDGNETPGLVDAGVCTGSHVYDPQLGGSREIEVVVLDAGSAQGRDSVRIDVARTCPACSASAPYLAFGVGDLEAFVASAADGDSVILSSGTYLLARPLVVDADITIQGFGAELDGGGGPVLDIRADDASLQFLTIRNGGSPAVRFGGGGIFQATSVTITGSGTGLEAGIGGGAVFLLNSTIADNAGDGLSVSCAELHLNNVTIAGNGQRGVSFDSPCGQRMEITNSLIVENGVDCGGSGGSMVPTGTASFDLDGTCVARGFSGFTTQDPQLLALSPNDVPLWTRALPASSPAVDAGDPSACPTHDQRTFLRSGAGCDLGAYEFGADLGSDNTPIGANVDVFAMAGVRLTFADVIASGFTFPTTLGPLPQTSFPVDGFVQGIPSTAVPSVGSTIEVCLPFRPTNPAPILYQFEAGPPAGWVSRTTSIDAVRHIVCGQSTTLAPVAVPEPRVHWAPMLACALATATAARRRRGSDPSPSADLQSAAGPAGADGRAARRPPRSDADRDRRFRRR